MFRFIKQLFCKHDHKITNRGYTQDFRELLTPVTNYTCTKCGYKSHTKGW